jgi:hypothetical protein
MTRPLIFEFFFGCKDIFAEHGQIEEVHIMRDKVNNNFLSQLLKQ